MLLSLITRRLMMTISNPQGELPIEEPIEPSIKSGEPSGEPGGIQVGEGEPQSPGDNSNLIQKMVLLSNELEELRKQKEALEKEIADQKNTNLSEKEEFSKKIIEDTLNSIDDAKVEEFTEFLKKDYTFVKNNEQRTGIIEYVVKELNNIRNYHEELIVSVGKLKDTFAVDKEKVELYQNILNIVGEYNKSIRNKDINTFFVNLFENKYKSLEIKDTNAIELSEFLNGNSFKALKELVIQAGNLQKNKNFGSIKNNEGSSFIGVDGVKKIKGISITV